MKIFTIKNLSKEKQNRKNPLECKTTIRKKSIVFETLNIYTTD
jgi:hypothetical protein